MAYWIVLALNYRLINLHIVSPPPLLNKAIKFLLEKELLNNTPEDVATYLFQNGMDKVALGDYLGEG